MAGFAKQVARYWDSTITGRHKIEACDLVIDALNQLVKTHQALSSGNIRSMDALDSISIASETLAGCQNLIKGLIEERKMFGQILSMAGDKVIPSRHGTISLGKVNQQFGREGEIIRLANSAVTKIRDLAEAPTEHFSNVPNISNQVAELIIRTITALELLDPGKTRSAEIKKTREIVSEYQDKMAARELANAAKSN